LLAGAILPGRWRILLSLRVLAILLLLVLLFKPAIEFSGRSANESELIILIDNSRSMDFADATGLSRIEYVKKLILENEDIVKEKPAAKIFVFADNLESISSDKVGDISVAGKATDITAAIKGIAEQINREKIQAIIVFTDGEHLGSISPKGAVAALNKPIYWLGVGSDNPRGRENNLSVDLVNPSIKVVTGGENYFTADILKSGTSSAKSSFDVYCDKELIVSRKVEFSSRQSRRSVDVSVCPKTSGKVSVKFQILPETDEYLRADNVRYWHCLSLPEKIRVLLIESQVSPEYKFLKQYLQSDSAIEFVSMAQIRPGKFLVTKQMAGFVGRSLPVSKEDFEKFDLFILGNISHRTFDELQGKILKEIIKGGRGVIFIAGDKLSDLRKSVLSELLPVRIEHKTKWISQPFVPSITLAGKASDILKNCVTFFSPESRYYHWVKLDGWFYVGSALPVSSVLMETSAGASNVGADTIPLLTIEPIGKGKSALISAAGFWRWALNPDVNLRENLYRVFWGQLIRNISGKELKGKQKPIAIVNLSKNSAKTGETIELSCYIFDEKASAITSVGVSAELVKDGKPILPLKLTQRKGYFAGKFTVEEPGEYRVRFKAIYGANELTDENFLKVYKVDKEFLQVTLNKSLLDELARVSGTEKMLPAEKFGEILNMLRRRYTQQLEHQNELHQFRLFDYRVFLMLLFVFVVSSEWILRYKWGLR